MPTQEYKPTTIGEIANSSDGTLQGRQAAESPSTHPTDGHARDRAAALTEQMEEVVEELQDKEHLAGDKPLAPVAYEGDNFSVVQRAGGMVVEIAGVTTGEEA